MSMKLTRAQAIQWHRRMWSWIAEKSLEEKRVVTKDEFIQQHIEPLHERDIHNECFCCEYAIQLRNRLGHNGYMCSFCPLEWESSQTKFMCVDGEYFDDSQGLYGQWELMTDRDYEAAAEIARLISNLPETDVDYVEEE